MRVIDVIPTLGELDALEVEEVARLVLEYLKQNRDRKAIFNKWNFSLPDTAAGYSDPRTACQILMEGWAHLEASGLIVTAAGDSGLAQHHVYVVSRRGEAINSNEDWERFRNAQRLPDSLLHHLVIQHAYPNYIRGAYDAAVTEAFKSVEVHVRDSGSLPKHRIGVELMGDAFGANGPLRDSSVLVGEADGTANVFRGAMGLWRNPSTHRRLGLDHAEAGQLLIFASRLLTIVDELVAKRGGGSTP